MAVRRACAAIGCLTWVESPRAFCSRHWGFLDVPARRELAEAWAPGQDEPGAKESPRWKSLLAAAKKAILERERGID